MAGYRCQTEVKGFRRQKNWGESAVIKAPVQPLEISHADSHQLAMDLLKEERERPPCR